MFSVPYTSTDDERGCGICGIRLRMPYPCSKAHPEHCHSCADISFGGTPLDNPAHDAPPLSTPPQPVPPPVRAVLDAATAAALDAYAAHVHRTEAAAMRRLRRAHEERD